MEEEGLDELKLAKFKTQNLKRSFEEASSVASSVLMFTLKWRDLEDHYDNMHKGFEEKAQELVLLKKGAEITNKVLDERHGEIALKEREFVSLQTQIEECSGQLEAKKKELALVEGLLGDCSLQFKSREKELELVKKSVKDCGTEFELKKEVLLSVKKSVQECDEKREGKEKELISVNEELESLCQEVNLKKEELQSVLKLIDTHQEELGSKERRLQVVQKMLDRFSIDASEKKKEIDDLQSSLKQASKEFEMRQGDLDKLKQLDDELQLKTKKLEFLEDLTTESQEKEQHVSSLRSLIEEYNEELVNKEKEYDSINKSIANCSAELKSKRKELEQTKNSRSQLVKELNLRKEELDEVGRDVQEAEKRLMSCNEALELKLRELDCLQKCVKDTDEQLQTKKASVENCKKELTVKEEQLARILESTQACSKDIQSNEQQLATVDEFSAQTESKNKEIVVVETAQHGCLKKLELKEKQVDSLKESVGELSIGFPMVYGELQDFVLNLNSEEKQIICVKQAIEEEKVELELKDKHNDSQKEVLEEHFQELDVKEGQIQAHEEALELKEKQMDALRQVVEEQGKELELKKEVNDAQLVILDEGFQDLHIKEGELQARIKDLESNEKRVDDLRQEFDEQRKELELKKQVNDSRKMLLDEGFQELHIKEGQLLARIKDLELKEKLVDAVSQAVEEQRKELELTKEANDSQNKLLDMGFQELHRKEAEFQACIKDFESKEKELNALHHAFEEQRKELEEREKLIDLQKMSLEEQMREVDMKEGHIKDHLKELEAKEKQMATFQLVMEEERKELELRQRQLTETVHSQNEIEKLDQLLQSAPAESQSTGAQLVPMVDGSSLQALLIRLLKKHDLVHKQMTSIIRTSPNPAALVLDAMRGFYPPYLKEDGEEFEINIVRKSCVLLLDQLIVNSLHIGPQARERASKLAHHWKTKMSVTSQNQLEILGFLHLLAAFRLVSSFNVNEIQALLDLVIDHNKALKLHQVLGISRRASASRILNHIRPEQLDRTIISNGSNTFSSDQVGTESLCVYEPTLREDDILYALQTSPDPAKFVLDVIQDRHCKYTKDQTHEGGFDDDCLKLCVFMLEHLMQISPPVQADVKKIATNLGVVWKERFKPDAANSLEVLVFLQFVAAYGLMSYLRLDRHEGFQLLQAIAYHKQARAVCRALNFLDTLSDAICDLVVKRNYVEAVRLVCAFELTDKFSPAELLEKYKEEIRLLAVDVCKRGKNTVEVQCMMIDRTIASLSEIIHCIRDFNLECNASSQVLETCIIELEKEKVRLRGSAAAPTCTTHMKRQAEAPECPVSADASASTNQLLVWGNKRVRTGGSFMETLVPTATEQCTNSSTPQEGLEVSRRIPARFGLTPEQIGDASDSNNRGTQQLLQLL